MILESLVKDDRIISFDCVKSQLTKDTKRINIPEMFIDNAEIQGAIRLGLCQFVESVPSGMVPARVVQEVSKSKFKNIHGTAISLECIKKLVAPGAIIAIPDHFLGEPEVANAIAWKILVPADDESFDAPAPAIQGQMKMNKPAPRADDIILDPKAPVVDELRISDIIENPTEVKYKREEKIAPKALVVNDEDVFDFLPKANTAQEDVVENAEVFSFLPEDAKADAPVEKTSKKTAKAVSPEVKPAGKIDQDFGFFDIYKDKK